MISLYLFSRDPFSGGPVILTDPLHPCLYYVSYLIIAPRVKSLNEKNWIHLPIYVRIAIPGSSLDPEAGCSCWCLTSRKFGTLLSSKLCKNHSKYMTDIRKFGDGLMLLIIWRKRSWVNAKRMLPFMETHFHINTISCSQISYKSLNLSLTILHAVLGSHQ